MPIPKYFITTPMCMDWFDQYPLEHYFYRCLVNDKTPTINDFKVIMYMELRNNLMEKYNIEKEKRFIEIDSVTYIDKQVIQAHLYNYYQKWLKKTIDKIEAISVI